MTAKDYLIGGNQQIAVLLRPIPNWPTPLLWLLCKIYSVIISLCGALIYCYVLRTSTVLIGQMEVKTRGVWILPRNEITIIPYLRSRYSLSHCKKNQTNNQVRFWMDRTNCFTFILLNVYLQSKRCMLK